MEGIATNVTTSILNDPTPQRFIPSITYTSSNSRNDTQLYSAYLSLWIEGQIYSSKCYLSRHNSSKIFTKRVLHVFTHLYCTQTSCFAQNNILWLICILSWCLHDISLVVYRKALISVCFEIYGYHQLHFILIKLKNDNWDLSLL